MKVKISLHGCDDSTIFDIECSIEQYEFLVTLSKKSKETSTYGCMPILKVRETP